MNINDQKPKNIGLINSMTSRDYKMGENVEIEMMDFLMKVLRKIDTQQFPLVIPTKNNKWLKLSTQTPY